MTEGKIKLRKEDTVQIIAGKDKGKRGKIIKILRDKDRVVVEGANIVKKAMKRKSQQDRGGIVEIEAPAGSTVVSGFVDVLVAGNGGTTDTLDIGDPTDDDRYTATAVDIKTTGRKTLTIGAGAFYYGKDGTTQKVRITAVQSGTVSTTGKVVVALQFLQLGKWYFTQG